MSTLRLRICLSACMCLSLWLPNCLYANVCLSVSISVWCRHLSASFSNPIFGFFWISLYVRLPACRAPGLSASLHFCMLFCISRCLSLCRRSSPSPHFCPSASVRLYSRVPTHLHASLCSACSKTVHC